ALIWSDDPDAAPEEREVPADLVDQVDEWRERLIERVVETDDALLHKYLEGEAIPEEDLRRQLRQGEVDGKFVPILCGSSLKNRGVQPLLDAVVDYLPSPLDVPPVAGRHPQTDEVEARRSVPEEPLAALAFKIVADPFVGKLSYV